MMKRCAICSFKGSSAEERVKHVERAHRRVPCPKCPQTFKKIKYLRQHAPLCPGLNAQDVSKHSQIAAMVPKKQGLNRKLPDSMDMICRFCKATFKKRIYMMRHVRKFHQKLTLRPATMMPSTIDTTKIQNTDMNSQEKRAQSEDHADTICRFCNLKFKRKRYLLRHVKKIHQELMLNSAVTMGTNSENESIVDVRKSQKSLKKNACDVSNNGSHSQLIINPFMSCDKKNKCNICGEKYFHKKHLQRHMSMFHEGGHNCPNCSQWFRLQGYFKRHLNACTSIGERHGPIDRRKDP